MMFRRLDEQYMHNLMEINYSRDKARLSKFISVNHRATRNPHPLNRR